MNMPRENGTGPDGRGPMTGRGRGFCVERATPELINRFWGSRFFGGGCGWKRNGGGPRGRGFRHRWGATGILGFFGVGPTEMEKGEIGSENDENQLKEQENILQQQLQVIQKRIEDLEKGKAP
jgi:hypothetical protein